MKRFVAVTLCIIVLIVTLHGCVSPYMKANIPCNQPGTTWSTEDGTVVFYVEEDRSFVHGYIQTEDGKVEVVITMSHLTSDLHISYKDDFYSAAEDDPVPHFALWKYSKVQKDVFVVEVLHSVFFQSGDILTFYKIDE